MCRYALLSSNEPLSLHSSALNLLHRLRSISCQSNIIFTFNLILVLIFTAAIFDKTDIFDRCPFLTFFPAPVLEPPLHFSSVYVLPSRQCRTSMHFEAEDFWLIPLATLLRDQCWIDLE